MSKLRIAIPEPYETTASLRTSVVAMKEAVEILLGQRGSGEDRAVTLDELPSQYVPPKSIADTAWKPFAYANGWVDYGVPYSPCGYRKLSSGLVILRGLVMNGTAATICTLPAGYRPGIQLLLIGETSPNAACRIDVSTGGVITHTGGNNGWLSLNNICFLAEN